MKTWLQKCSAVRGSQWLLLFMALGFTLWAFFPSGEDAGSSQTDDETRIAQTLSLIEGAGDTRVVIYYGQDTSGYNQTALPTGAIIVSRGAGDIQVQLRLTMAAQTLLGLSPDQVQVFPMEEEP